MALDISVADVQLSFLSIAAEGDAENTIHLNADWLALDDQGAMIGIISQQKDTESRPFAEYPADVRTAIQTLNTYAVTRIKAAKGIS